MRAVLANPRCTGRQVWNRRRTDHDLVDPANTTLGHRDVMRWNTPSDWIISARPAQRPALVSEADFITVQNLRPRHQTAQGRTYLLAGLLCCGVCGGRMESHWSHDSPGYRCRHGHTGATRPGPGLAGQMDHPGRAAVSKDAMRPPTPARAIVLPPQSGDLARLRRARQERACQRLF
ncbi:recombinase zinc beta ribbon domain-containing protein [Streptomyces sp. NPDC002076]